MHLFSREHLGIHRLQPVVSRVLFRRSRTPGCSYELTIRFYSPPSVEVFVKNRLRPVCTEEKCIGYPRARRWLLGISRIERGAYDGRHGIA
jgi:hypothetical protein